MRLKELRIKRNLSQKALGEIFGVTSQTILNWENSIFEPSIAMLIKLSDFFNVSIDYLVDRKQSPDIYQMIQYELGKLSKEEYIDLIIKQIKSKKSK